MSREAFAAAMEYRQMGLCPIPVDYGAKKPAVQWKAYMNQPPTLEQVDIWFDNLKEQNIAIVCGKASNGLTVLDFDDVAQFNSVLADNPTLATWIVRTPSGGGHIYLRTGSLPTVKIGGIEIRSQGTIVVAPPSSFESRGYEFIRQTQLILVTRDLRALGLGIDLPAAAGVCDVTADPRPRIWPIGNLSIDDSRQALPTPSTEMSQLFLSLPEKARRILVGSWEGYPSRSEAEQALMCIFVIQDLPFDQIKQLSDAYAGPGKYQQKRRGNPETATEYLWHNYEKAKQTVGTTMPKATRQIAELIHLAESVPWAGRFGGYNRVVYLAYLTLAQRAHSLTFAASVRDVAERAGIALNTVCSRTKILCSMGLLHLVERGQKGNAYTWQIRAVDEDHPLRKLLVDTLNTPPPCVIVYRLIDEPTAAEDVFRRKGLGKSAVQIWDLLLRQPATTNEIVDQTGRCRETVRHNLDRMCALSLVQREVDTFCISPEADLKLAGEWLGVAGKREQQHATHLRQREGYRKVLDNEWRAQYEPREMAKERQEGLLTPPQYPDFFWPDAAMMESTVMA